MPGVRGQHGTSRASQAAAPWSIWLCCGLHTWPRSTIQYSGVKIHKFLIYLWGLGEPPQKAQGQGSSNVKIECIQDLHFHVSNLLLSVGVVSDIHAVTNRGAHYLLIFSSNQQAGDSDQLELRLWGTQSNLKWKRHQLNAETKILAQG